MSEQEKRLKRIEKVLRLKEEIALIDKVDAERRLSIVMSHQDDIGRGRGSLFERMIESAQGDLARRSLIDAKHDETGAIAKSQKDIQKVRGMQKSLERIATQVAFEAEVQARTERVSEMTERRLRKRDEK